MQAISIAVQMRRYDAGHIARYSTSQASLDVAIGRVLAWHCRSGRHGQRIWSTKKTLTKNYV